MMQKRSKEILHLPIERSNFINHFSLQQNGERSLLGEKDEDYICMETWNTDHGYTFYSFTHNTGDGEFVYPVGGGVSRKAIDFSKPVFSKPNIPAQVRIDSFSVSNSTGKTVFSSK